MLTQGIPPDFRGGVHLFIPPYAIGPVSRLSGHAFAYMPMAFTAESPPAQGLSPQGSSSNGCFLFCRYHHGPIFERLSFPTPMISCSLPPKPGFGVRDSAGRLRRGGGSVG